MPEGHFYHMFPEPVQFNSGNALKCMIEANKDGTVFTYEKVDVDGDTHTLVTVDINPEQYDRHYP